MKLAVSCKKDCSFLLCIVYIHVDISCMRITEENVEPEIG